MRAGTVVVAALAAALLGGVPVSAQSAADEKLKVEQEQKEKQYQEQALREAERKMREAEREMREAQREVERAARRMAELHADTAREHARMDRQFRTVWFGNRARLGVVVRTKADPKTDAVGAALEAVSPGGPAEKAGLRAGDVVISVNGEKLAGSRTDIDEDESAPGLKLIELASDLEEDEKVVIEYKRGDTLAKATVVAQSLGPRAMKIVKEAPDVRVHVDVDPDIEPFVVGEPYEFKVMKWTGRWMDMELVSLNSELGEYFGATEGVLVVRAPKDEAAKIKAGDVIVKIGDRTPSRPEQAMRILRSYEPGEKVPVEVIRKRAKTALTLEVPKEDHLHHMFIGEPPAPPAPSAPPAPPAKAPKAPKGTGTSESL